MTANDLTRTIQLLATDIGSRLFRNNTGRLQTRDGRWVHFGIPHRGGSDLLGWTAIEITQEMVGQSVPVFTAIEIKVGKDKLTEQQSSWLATVKQVGGYSGVARCEEDAWRILKIEPPER